MGFKPCSFDCSNCACAINCCFETAKSKAENRITVLEAEIAQLKNREKYLREIRQNKASMVIKKRYESLRKKL